MKGIPDGIAVLTPRLYCRDPAAEVAFCTAAFGAVERGHRADADGNVLHALLDIGPATIMIEAESSSLTSRPPATDGSSPVVFYIYVEDVDRTVERAVAAGAKVLFPVANQFWGDRMGWVMDPAGHVWSVATRIEETTASERDARWSTIKSDIDAMKNRSAPTATITPILIYEDVAKAIEWLCKAFDFTERLRAERDGVIFHAQLSVGEGAIMLGRQGGPYRAPQGKEVTAYVLVHVDDVDKHYEHAKLNGADIVHPPNDMPFGERSYTTRDHAGHWWTFSQHIADVAPEQWGAKSAST